jgi:hypothetical protein
MPDLTLDRVWWNPPSFEIMDFIRFYDHNRNTHKFGWVNSPVEFKQIETLITLHSESVGTVLKGGCAIGHDGTIRYVWSSGGKLLPRLMKLARNCSGKRLVCYDTGLVEMYKQCGLHVVREDAFVKAFAPPLWLPEHGEPAIVAMAF